MKKINKTVVGLVLEMLFAASTMAIGLLIAALVLGV